MNEPKRRIVVTGIGPVTPIGCESAPFWDSLSNGTSGIRPLRAFEPGSVATQLAAEVVDFEPKKYIKQRKSIKVMARDIQLAVAAAQIALDDAKLAPETLDPLRFGVNCGAGLIATELDELGPPVAASCDASGDFDIKKWGVDGLKEMFPLWMLKYLPNMPACHISIIHNGQGPNNSITAGEASATLAIGEAFRVMARGAADVFIAGGSDSKINPLSMVRLELLGRLSKRWATAPEQASRPFDAERDGLIAGEGAGMLVFEERRHAEKRGARIYAEVLGFGSSCTPRDHSKGATLALKRALVDAKIAPAELTHVASGAAGELAADRFEAAAIAAVLGDAAATTPVVAYKSYCGHLAAASGGIELIASLLAAQKRVLPPTLNFQRPDAELAPIQVLNEKKSISDQPFALLDVSHTGHCGALVVRPE